MSTRNWVNFFLVALLTLVVGLYLGVNVGDRLVNLPGNPSEIHAIIPLSTEVQRGGELHYSLVLTRTREDCSLEEIASVWEHDDGTYRIIDMREPRMRVDLGVQFRVPARIVVLPEDILSDGWFFVSLRYSCLEGRRAVESPRMHVRFD